MRVHANERPTAKARPTGAAWLQLDAHLQVSRAGVLPASSCSCRARGVELEAPSCSLSPLPEASVHLGQRGAPLASRKGRGGRASGAAAEAGRQLMEWRRRESVTGGGSSSSWRQTSLGELKKRGANRGKRVPIGARPRGAVSWTGSESSSEKREKLVVPKRRLAAVCLSGGAARELQKAASLASKWPTFQLANSLSHTHSSTPETEGKKQMIKVEGRSKWSGCQAARVASCSSSKRANWRTSNGKLANWAQRARLGSREPVGENCLFKLAPGPCFLFLSFVLSLWLS